MQDEDLIRMSRQIADFFAPYTEEEAVAGIAGHLRSFWDPRMRRQLLDIGERTPDRLHPQVRTALARLEAG